MSRRQKIFPKKLKGFGDGLSISISQMRGKPLPSLSPISFKNVDFMGLKMGNGRTSDAGELY